MAASGGRFRPIDDISERGKERERRGGVGEGVGIVSGPSGLWEEREEGQDHGNVSSEGRGNRWRRWCRQVGSTCQRERGKTFRERFVRPWGSIQCWARPAVSVRFLFFLSFFFFLFILFYFHNTFITFAKIIQI
jgi:hypothetical protein